jgi:biopolymer transport protein ExbD
MDLAGLKAMLAAPMAALFLVLVLVAFGQRQGKAVGVPLKVYAIPPDPSEFVPCDHGGIVVEIDRAGRVGIVPAEIPRAKLRQLLGEILENRYERRVYVAADSGVPYQDFVDILSRIEGASQGLQVVLLSGELRRKQEEKWVFPCVYIWPMK